MKTIACAAVALVLAAAGCGVRPTGVVDGGPAPIATANAERYPLYFVSKGRLTAEMLSGDPSVPGGLLRILAYPPSRPGLTSDLHGLRYENGVALDHAGVAYAISYVATGHRLPSRLARGQIVCTLTARPPTRTVRLSVYRSDTLIHRWNRLTCDDFRDLRAR